MTIADRSRPGTTTSTARDDVLETVTRVFWHTDHHQWDDLTAVFDRRVRLDYTAIAGGEPAEVTPADIVAAWRPGFEAIDAHQHLVTNHLVEIRGDRATVTAAFHATHRYAEQQWTLGGDYRFELARRDEGWRVSAMTMTPTWQTGNPRLLAEALEGGPSTHPSTTAS